MDLRKKTIEGLTWSGASQAGKLVSQFIITAVLARLLSPSDFGLLGMALVFTRFAEVFGEMGMSDALIQKRDVEQKHYASVFWLNIAVGIGLMLLTISLSPYIAMFYNKPDLQPILVLLSATFVITSFGIVQKTIFTKEMEFKKLAVLDLTAIVSGGIAGIYFACRGYGVLSLVYQLLTYTFVNMSLLWLFSRWRPKFIFSLSAIKDVFHFSTRVTGANVVNYFARNIDYLLIGKFLGTQALGFYTLAYKLMIFPLRNISWVISEVMFPAFAKIQKDLKKIRSVYLKMVKSVSLVTFPMMLGLFALAPNFVNVIYGPKWEPAIILVRILCICGMGHSILAIVGNIILSQGRADLYLRLGVVGTFFVSLAVVTGLKWGLTGVACFYTAEQILWGMYVYKVVNRMINLRSVTFYRTFVNSLAIGISILLFVVFLRLVIPASQLYVLLGSVIGGLSVYVWLLIVFKEIEFRSGRLFLNFIRNEVQNGE